MFIYSQTPPRKSQLGLPTPSKGLTAEKVLRKTSVMQAFTSRTATAEDEPEGKEAAGKAATGLQDKRKTFKKVATATKLLSGVKADARETKKEAGQ